MLDYVYIMKKKIYKTLKSFTDQYFKSFSIVYKREYIDSEDQYDSNFWIGHSIYKNVPISKIKFYRKQLLKIKDILDRSFKEDVLTLQVVLVLKLYIQMSIKHTKMYLKIVFKGDLSLFNDYGQLYKRQGFRKDFDFNRKLQNKKRLHIQIKLGGHYGKCRNRCILFQR